MSISVHKWWMNSAPSLKSKWNEYATLSSSELQHPLQAIEATYIGHKWKEGALSYCFSVYELQSLRALKKGR